ncbi:cilia- and flagella-associated protein 20 isoform X2 [Lucilia sericata]|uniref:cilia- and flagella-associated protein 20 isoform X2 n=1 Tax=Lucilia sericata TaxID=13632 RepID=UPI0018A8223E|nr:cilia- and flagella-associated protein 20 isoform X2 [Lucilia sericata]
MYRTVYQKGCFSVFYSVGGRPLSNWSIHAQNGYVKRVLDDDIKSMVLEIMGSNVSTMYISCPREAKQELAIKLPFLVLLVKNMHKYFTFEVQILDDQHFFRRFRVSNFQSKTSVKPFCTSMPMGMSPGWNQIHFNLADFTRRAYGTNYMETEDELPNEYRLIQQPKTKRSINWGVPVARPPSPQSQRLKEVGEGAASTVDASSNVGTTG